VTVRRTILTIDRTARFLRWSPGAFDPADKDALAATSRLTFSLTRSAKTTLQIYDTTGRLIRNAWIGRALVAGPAAWTWDGRDGHRQLVPAGSYVAVLTTVSSLGTSVLRRTVIADAFLVGVDPAQPTAGSPLTL